MKWQTYTCLLNALNEATAEFTNPAYPNLADAKGWVWTMPREDWERAGRPSEVYVQVTLFLPAEPIPAEPGRD